MRLTWSAMLQANNNNNYPCLKASPREAPLKCPLGSQPLPSRLELGLADLPLIRGLRAWALCSKNRQKGATPPSGAPVTPPTGRRTSCPRPADVHLSGTWGPGYGLPQAGAGALVTVATLKTSEGNGKTQTQCLFLRNDKGLYSPCGGISGAGAWLRGKPGTGRRDVSAPQTQTAASRVRVRSGRRWRKSTHPVGREKRHPDGEVAENQEKQGKAILQRLVGTEEEGCREQRGPRQKEGACQKICGPAASLECLQNTSDEETLRNPSHVVSQDKKTLEDVTERGNKLDPVCQTSLDESPCLLELIGCFENAFKSERKSSHVACQDKRVPDEEVTKKQEEPDKVSPEHLASPAWGLWQESRELQSSGCHRNVCKEESARREGTLCGEITGTKRELEKNSEENEEGKGLCKNGPSILLGPNPDVEFSHSHSECKAGKDSINITKRPDEEKRIIQTPFDDITASSRSIEDPEGELCQVGRALGNIWPDPEPEHNVTNTTESSSRRNVIVDCEEGKETDWTPNEVTPVGPCLHNPTLALPSSGAMATSQPCVESEEVEKRGQDGIELESRDKKTEEEEDEFGGFMQADGEECSRGVADSVPVSCGSSAEFASSDWKPTWKGSTDTWTAFPRWDQGRDSVGQWWPDEERTDEVDHKVGFLFATAFPSLPTSAPRHPADVIPTLTQLLRESSSQEQRLLDGLHDVSKMSIHKHKRGVSVSRGLLLSSLHVEQPSSDNRATNRWSNRRPSPGLHSPNRYTHNVVAKRRLSYDYNRSGPE
ncbi:uncharacterized protein si:ch211-14c7.2 [Syngnathus scovelli]|uniref:uncharacterized protein si:ch211-14c7.2 n=1 Tax=Syngnathus scovelli TaxID=161590 RepID=UPI00210F8FC3|nr:uncharacterized protein si:ch211-14c7.2 [Syngnathus scovelli]